MPAGALRLGEAAELARRFGAADVAEHAALCGDEPGDTVPPALVGALLSCLLGVHLPGPGTNYLKQSTRFHRDPRVDETVIARVQVTRLRPEKSLVDLATTCLGEDGRVLAEGRALVRWDGPETRANDGA